MSARLDDAVRRAAPITDDELGVLDLDAFEAELREAILAEPVPVRGRGARRRRRFVPAAGALVAAAMAAAIVFLSGGGGTDRAWAAEAVRVAEAVPRLLIDGWEVRRADQFDVGMGEMEFTRGDQSVELSWRRDGRVVEKDRTIVGWREGDYLVEIHGEAAAEARAGVRRVSVDEWLGAMPKSVVQPVDSEKVIDEMLRDLPLPPVFDRSQLDVHGAPRDRYQLGARVVAQVACGWFALWVSGDAKERAEAVATMKNSPTWGVVKELATQGHYHEVLAQYVDAIATDGTVIGGKELTVAESYKDALGC